MNRDFGVTQQWRDNLRNVPDFWKGSLEDLEQIIKTVKRGRGTMGCKSAGGRPVYMVEYGERNQYNRTSTYGSATCVNGRDFAAYADKTRQGIKPCLMLIGGVYGAEFEGVVALVNLIQLLETGKDFMGNENAMMYEMPERIHLVLVLCANPDGCARYPYKTVSGLPIKTFRYCAQGSMKNGELFWYPACKLYHPIKEYSDFLGCYFNDDGVNIQQEDIMHQAEETKFLISTAKEFAPGIIIQLHGGNDTTGALCDNSVMPSGCATR